MRSLFALATVALMTAASLAQSPTFDKIAPENTVFVIGVDDPLGSQKRLESHPAFAGLGDPQGMMDQAGEMLGEQFEDMVGGGGDDAMPVPQGPLGAAVFVVTDPEIGVARPGVLLYGDFGDGAGKVVAYLKKAAGQAAEQGAARMSTREAGGREIVTIELIEGAGDDEIDFDDMDMDDPGDDPFAGMMPDVSDLFGQFDKVHVVQSGRVVLLGTDMPSLADALASLDGKERRTLSGNRVFQEIRGQLGPGEGYAVLLSKDLLQLVAGADPMGMAMMMMPMLRAAFGEIKGWGYTLQVPEGPMQHRAAVLMPYGKQGLPRLLDTPGPRKAPPAFVSADAPGYTSMNVDLDGVVPLVQQVLQSNPMFQMQLGPQWEQFRPIVHDICSALGSNVHIVQTGAGASPSEAAIMAIDCRDAARVRAMLDDAGEQLGLVGRDLAGHRVWTVAPNPMMQGMAPGMGDMDSAIGLRGDVLFIGDAAAVDDALTGAEPANKLAESPAFRTAMRAMGSNDVVAWGYNDLTRAAGAFGGANMGGVGPEDMGTTIWWVQSTKNGFVATAQHLQPVQAVNVVTDQP